MFYYPNVLQYRTGCFSTVWLAATKAIKISRRDYLKVNVQRTCDDIMDYVLVRAPPLQPGLPRPRFSLYLSFLLQYGVIIIYHRQCVILLEEVQHTIDRLLRSGKKLKIDLPLEFDRPAPNVPDSLAMLEESERALDPFFGEMGYYMPSPSIIIQQWPAAEETSPPRALVESPRTPARHRITASPDAITLIDREPVVSPPVLEFEGVDLPVVTPSQRDIIDLLMEQPDQFPEEVEEREQEREAERIRDQQQITVSGEQLGVTMVTTEDLTMLPEREAGRPVPTVTPPSPLAPPPQEITPVPAIPLPPAPEREREQGEEEREREPVRERGRRRRQEREKDTSVLDEPEPAAPPKKQRRRRQLVFIDPHTQIPSHELQEAVQDPLTETLPLVLFEPPSRRRISPEELLNNPCSTLHPHILDLWRTGAVITPLPSVAARRRLSEEEMESERESVMLERGEDSEMREEISPKEIVREPEELGQPQPEVSVSIELLGEEVSRFVTPESRGSPTGDIPFPLEDIPEEGVRLAEEQPEQVAATRETLMRMLWMPLQEHRKVPFHSLLPPLADRSIVARSFSTLIESASARTLSVQQDEPYGTIMISAGPLYEQQRDWVPQTD